MVKYTSKGSSILNLTHTGLNSISVCKDITAMKSVSALPMGTVRVHVKEGFLTYFVGWLSTRVLVLFGFFSTYPSVLHSVYGS